MTNAGYNLKQLLVIMTKLLVMITSMFKITQEYCFTHEPPFADGDAITDAKLILYVSHLVNEAR